jgi:hypothetical protein
MNTWLKKLIGASALLVLAAVPALAQVQALDSPSTDKVSATAQYEDDFDYSSQTLRVGVWMEGKDDREVLQKGEKFAVGFQTNQDAYAVVYRIDTEGEVSILWPRSRFDDGFVFGGHEYKLPVAGKRRLVAGGEAGEGFVQAIVSSYPFDLRELELDFHHEYTDEPFRFAVAGDPFLAMNEVNYVVTGLEDSGDYVVTNYISYYVHHKVDHPRYLCNQCHFDDEVAYHPYNDSCTLEISYDHDWGNSWYDHYGFYPVYYQPVYVYYDPWTYNPWVNWWYYPRYRCAPTWGWGWRSSYTYWSWYDSPYYWGDCYDYYHHHHNHYASTGTHRRWGPLDRHYAANHSRTKTRELGRASSLVGRAKLGDRDRLALENRTPVAGRARDEMRVPTRDRTVRGRDAMRIQTRVTGDASLRSGLRIRDNNRVRIGGREGTRHISGGGDRPAQLKPVSREPARDERGRGTTVIRPSSNANTRQDQRSLRRGGTGAGSDRSTTGNTQLRRPNGDSSRATKPSQDSRTIKPVEPRRKGTRIWNTSPSGGNERNSSDRITRPSGGRDKPTVQPRRGTRGNRNSGSSSVTKPRSNSSRVNKPKVDQPRSNSSRSSKPKSTQPRVRPNNNSSPKSTPTVKPRSSGGNSSSKARSSSGGSRNSSSSSSGKSRGGSSKRR